MSCKYIKLQFIFDNKYYDRFIRENMFTEEVGDRQNVPNFVIVITDGKSDEPIVRTKFYWLRS